MDKITLEINRISNAVTAAYTAAQGKGATMPATQNVASLASTIDSISAAASDEADYVVEQGTYGARWNYRKWASGIGECWGVFGDSMVNVNSAWGGVYYGGWMNSDANKAGRKYPFDFVSEPSVTAQYIGGNNDAWIVSDRGNNINALTHAPAFSLVRPSAGTIYNPKLSYYVIGRWK